MEELEKKLIVAAKGPQKEISLAGLRKRGLLAILRERKRGQKPKT
jgi:hypothetical protein